MADVKPRSRPMSAKATAEAAAATGKPKEYNKQIGHFRYSEADVLGEGAYGAVFKAYDISRRDSALAARTDVTGAPDVDLPAELRGCRVVALKQMSNPKKEDGLAAATLREVAILKELCHVWRSDQRNGSLAHQGGVVNYINNSALPSRALGRSTTGGEVTEFSLTDQGNSSEGADDFTAYNSTPSTMPSPASFGGEFALSSSRLRDPAAIIALGRRHVVELMDVVIDSKTSKVFIALEFCEGGDVWHYLRSLPTRRISDARVFRRWVREMVLGVAFMHQKRISHRDLKPQNIMLKRRSAHDQLRSRASQPSRTGLRTGSAGSASIPDLGKGEKDSTSAGDKFSLKVADFGLSRVEGIPVKKYIHEAVTLWYRSPDVLLGNTNYTYTADAWSLGCIIIEVASGAAPFRGKDEIEQLKRICVRLGGPLRKDLPSMADYPHSGTYASILEEMVQYHDKEEKQGTFTEREAYEIKLMLDSGTTGPQAMLTEIASNRARLRLLLDNREGGMDVLGEDGLDMVARMLVMDPQKRLTILEAVQHPFMRSCLEEDPDLEDWLSETHSMHLLEETGGGSSGTPAPTVPIPGPPMSTSSHESSLSYRRPQHSIRSATNTATIDAGATTAGWNAVPVPRFSRLTGSAAARAATAASQPVLPGHPGTEDDANDANDAGVSLPALGAATSARAAGTHVPVATGPPNGLRSHSGNHVQARRGSSAAPAPPSSDAAALLVPPPRRGASLDAV